MNSTSNLWREQVGTATQVRGRDIKNRTIISSCRSTVKRLRLRPLNKLLRTVRTHLPSWLGPCHSERTTATCGTANMRID